MFGRSRDVSLIRGLNRELLHDIITQQAAIYKFKLEETKTNLYGEAAGEKFYDGPFLFNCLIDREDESYSDEDSGINFAQGIEFRFLRADLVDAEVKVEVGDIVLYQNNYYQIDNVSSNKYFVGKNPDYPNNNDDGTDNPLNPGLDDFGVSLSVIVKTHKVPSDKVGISSYKERF